jgi:16S rRNA (guanine(527)-N(7))-methyltransferase RsmG
MDKHHSDKVFTQAMWDTLAQKFLLTEKQIEQLEVYGNLLIEWNSKFNLTAILEPEKIVSYHFYDSLAISSFVDFNTVETVADVGTGAGFPGIPLKILFPHLFMIFIEVNSKKRTFIEYVMKTVGLEGFVTYGEDWRTFLRSTSYPVNYFLARASLQPSELVRIFKPSSSYRNAKMIYWASQKWMPEAAERRYMSKEIEYDIARGVTRKFVFFHNKNDINITTE